MKARLLLATLVLTTAPSFVMAMGCGGGHFDEATLSCPEGQSLDIKTNTCISPTG